MTPSEEGQAALLILTEAYTNAVAREAEWNAGIAEAVGNPQAMFQVLYNVQQARVEVKRTYEELVAKMGQYVAEAMPPFV